MTTIMSQRRSQSNSTAAAIPTRNSTTSRVTFAEDDEDEDDDEGDYYEDEDDESEEGDEGEEVGTLSLRSTKNRKNGDTGISQNSQLEVCQIPTFQLPRSMMRTDSPTKPSNHHQGNNNNNHRYELWTLRIPASVNLQDLNDTTIPMALLNHTKHENEADDTLETIVTVNNNNTTACPFQFRIGQAVENESFRLLTAPTPTNPSDDKHHPDKLLRPSSVTFQKHVNVVVIPSTAAIKPNTPPPPQHKQQHQQRHAYAPVPQKIGLKRRWVPFGTTTKSLPSANGLSFRTSIDTTRNSATKKCHPPPAMNSVVIKKENNGGTLINDTATPIKLEMELPVVPDQTEPASSTKRQRDDNDDDHHHEKKKKKHRSKEEKKAMKKERKKEKKEKLERL